MSVKTFELLAMINSSLIIRAPKGVRVMGRRHGLGLNPEGDVILNLSALTGTLAL
jgi:hypothetical protein